MNLLHKSVEMLAMIIRDHHEVYFSSFLKSFQIMCNNKLHKIIRNYQLLTQFNQLINLNYL